MEALQKRAWVSRIAADEVGCRTCWKEDHRWKRGVAGGGRADVARRSVPRPALSARAHLNAWSSRKYVTVSPSGLMGISSFGTRLLNTNTKLAVYRSRLSSL
jgi:hypothetical protein